MPGPSSMTSSARPAVGDADGDDDRVTGRTSSAFCDEVAGHLREPIGVALHGDRLLAARAARARSPASSASGRKPSTVVGDDVGEVDRLERHARTDGSRAWRGRAGRRPGGRAVAPRSGSRHRPRPASRQRAVGDRFGVALDRRERRAQVVRHRQQELPLESLRSFERLGHRVDRLGQRRELVLRARVGHGQPGRQVARRDAPRRLLAPRGADG